VAYYRTEEGKIKKQQQNSKRSRGAPGSEPKRHSKGEEKQPVEGLSNGAQNRPRFDGDMVLYLVMVVRLIEGWTVSIEEILEMLQRAVRQHSMVRQRRADYLVWHLNRHPP